MNQMLYGRIAPQCKRKHYGPVDQSYIENLCAMHEEYRNQWVSAIKQLSLIETKIKQAARERNVDLRDVKYIFKRIR